MLDVRLRACFPEESSPPMFRRPAAASAALLAAVLVGAPAMLMAPAPAAAQVSARRDASAEAFVAAEARMALDILHNSGMSTAAKKAAFRQFVDRAADVPKITGFVLGKYRRSVSPQQYQDFAAAFRAYANNVYESRLSRYKGEDFRVTGSQVRTPSDVVVNSQVVGGELNRQANVAWRLNKDAAGRWRVVDVNIAGVWLAITQQQDFVSTLDNNRGDIGVLIGQLRGQRS